MIEKYYDTEEVLSLQHQLLQPKPGFEAHQKLSPAYDNKRLRKYYTPSEDAKEAAVMLMLYKQQSQWNTVFMQRSSQENDKHSGQISFPGGRLEHSDDNLMDCALRETEEELGINRNKIKVLGALSPLFVFASNHLVQPYVGVMDPNVTYEPNKLEVAEVIDAPIGYFLNEKNLKVKDIAVREGVIKDVPYFDLFGKVLWGATAMILSEFLHIWNQKSDS